MLQVTPKFWVLDYGIAAGQVFNTEELTILNIPTVEVQGECSFAVNVFFDSDDSSLASQLQPRFGYYRQNLGETVAPGQLQNHVVVALYNPTLGNLTATKGIQIRILVIQLSSTSGFFSPQAG